MYFHSKKFTGSLQFMTIFVILALCSCNVFWDQLDIHPLQPRSSGKFYWAYSIHDYTGDTIGKPLVRDEIYYDYSEFDSRSGTFNIDTYINNEIVRHQVIVNRDHIYDSNTDSGLIIYIDESNQHTDHYYFLLDNDIYFEPDFAQYIITRSFPFAGRNVRNYFVKYSWGQ